jgi:hypothetical protein
MFSLCLITFLSSCGMNVKPSTTTVTYGQSNTDTEKEANNDSTTDSEKVTWSVKQVFKWGKE